jgi:hypothetical protein
MPKLRRPPVGSPHGGLDELTADLTRIFDGNRTLARRLGSSLWTIPQEYPDQEAQYEAERNQAAYQIDVAHAIQGSVRNFLRALNKHKATILKALRRQYVPASSVALNPHRLKPRDLRIHWAAAERAEDALEDMTGDIANWVQRARADLRRRPAKRVSGDPRYVELIGIKLAHAGVPLTGARTGKFAKVVSAVRLAAGQPPTDPTRLVRQALKSGYITLYLGRPVGVRKGAKKK